MSSSVTEVARMSRNVVRGCALDIDSEQAIKPAPGSSIGAPSQQTMTSNRTTLCRLHTNRSACATSPPALQSVVHALVVGERDSERRGPGATTRIATRTGRRRGGRLCLRWCPLQTHARVAHVVHACITATLFCTGSVRVHLSLRLREVSRLVSMGKVSERARDTTSWQESRIP